jgi:hypothetical protein
MSTAIIPVARCPIDVRPGTTADLPFMDSLQKMHSHMVGWMPGKQLEGKIAAGHVLVAGDAATRKPLGYVIAEDRYFKRDDVGILYQVNVLPMQQRNLIGATLIKAVFERAAYGCRLFSCWCAQDIRANFFWESLGFVPLAFRTGSAAKQRIHIFWQRRTRANDAGTPYWFPAQTGSGSIRQDRLVLPIPQGVHWRDVMPIVLPGMLVESEQPEVPNMLPGGAPVRPRPDQPKLTKAQKAAIHRSQSKHLQGVPLGKKAVLTPSGVRYVERTDYVPEMDAPEELTPETFAKANRPRNPRVKNDPQLVAAARELRDRWLEEYNSGNLALPEVGRYDVSTQLVMQHFQRPQGDRVEIDVARIASPPSPQLPSPTAAA